MSLLELFLLAVGLSMDAFAVSVCKGLSVRRGSMKQALTVGIWFGGFQALMPFLGYLLGITFSSLITSIDHWIAFVLLAFIGFNMIREARSDEENESNDRFDFKTMLPLAVATSIDALAVGVTFAFLRVNIVPAVSFIGCITFLLSAIGLKAGNIIGANIIDLTLILPVCALIYGSKLPASPTVAMVDIPACLIIGILSVVPTLITKKFSRWQGVLMLAAYAVYIVLSVIVMA